MTSIALLLAIAPLAGFAADLQSTLTLSDFSQLLVRPRDDGVSVMDMETMPVAGISFKDAASRVDLSYGPRFSLRDTFGDQRETLIFHSARAGWSVAGPRVSFTLTQSTTFGRQSLATAALAPTPAQMTTTTTPPDPTVPRINLLTTQTLETASEQTSAAVGYAWDRRWRSTFSAGYGISGGLGTSAQTELPQLKMATGGVSTSYSLSPRDRLATSVLVTQSVLSNGFDHWIALATESWSRDWTKDVSGTLLLGLSASTSRDEPSPLPRKSALLPSAAASVSGTVVRQREYTVTLVAGTAVTPVISPLTGALQPRLQGSGTFQIAHDQTSAAATVDVAQTLPLDDPNEARVVGAGVGVTQRLGELVDLSARYRSIWQQANQLQGQQVASLPRQWSASLALSVRAPPLTF